MPSAIDDPTTAFAILHSLTSTIPPNEATHFGLNELPDPDIKGIADIVDAIVSFLPTKSDHAYAISLEIGEQVRICLAANNEQDFLEGQEHAPARTIEIIWSGLKLISATADQEERLSTEWALVLFIFQVHWSRMKYRFEKKAVICQRFFDEFVDKKQVPEEYGDLLSEAKRVFLSSKNIFQLQEPTKEQLWDYYKSCGKANKVISKARKKLATTGWLTRTEIELEWQLERELELNSQEQVSVKRFKFLRYVDKIVGPSRRINVLAKAAVHPIFPSTSQLVVQCIYPELTDAEIPQPDPAQLCSYIQDAWGSNWPLPANARTAVIDKTVANVQDNWSKLVQAPHCETVLLRHHSCRFDTSAPYPYFGISKLSCLQCGLFFAAYRDSARPWFQTRGCRMKVIPCRLPGTLGNDTMDESVKTHMMLSIKEFIRGILLRKIETLHDTETESDESSREILIPSPEVQKRLLALIQSRTYESIETIV